MLHQLNSKSNGLVCYYRLSYGTETVPFRLVLRIARLEMVETQKLDQFFSRFDAMS